MATETGWSDWTTPRGWVAVYPEGTPTNPTMPNKFLTNPARWNDGSPPMAEWPEAPDDSAFIRALLDDLPQHVAIDPSRLYLTGFSNGAGMTFRAAAELPGRFAAIAPVAGHCWADPQQPIPPTPTIYLIGRDDPMVPVYGGPVKTPWRDEVKPSAVETLQRWAAVMGDPECIESEVIDGLGHHWPGGAGRLNPRIAGPPTDRVDGTARIGAFFERHKKP